MGTQERPAARRGVRAWLPLVAGVIGGSVAGIGGSLIASTPGAPNRATHQDPSRGRAQESRLLARHRSEPVDPRFSVAATAQLRSELADRAPRVQAVVVDVQCRRSICVAELEWKDFASAGAGYQAIVTGTTRSKCTSSMTLAEPAVPALPFRARLIVDCPDDRRSSDAQ
jgi:hypothetical protein